MATAFTVNGKRVEVTTDAETPLIYALRNELGLRGTRFGCGGEDCSACLVIVDQTRRCSCTYLVADAAGKSVQTIEGITGNIADILREAFVEAGAGQCGYCLSGIFVTAHELVAGKQRPSIEEVKKSLGRHLCRCGAHAAILRGIGKAIDAVDELGGYRND
ncbi:(2Fe-2S)-binding protein [Bradyrhizobium sacchari]|uniref:(2Fe-2S)-binding protein n=1 Tax=Bradyrhizobium sacchari TaxID=1399419 RepID=UPI0009B07A57|nr:2Fe-2S iron-sulfur cluster-binding protein [Bradyrhizobium sacchari]